MLIKCSMYKDKKVDPKLKGFDRWVELAKKHTEHEIGVRANALARAENLIPAVKVALHGGRDVSGDRLFAFVIEYDPDLISKPVEDFHLIALKAGLASRNERMLAKELPGFLWRARDQIDLLTLADAATRTNLGTADDSKIVRNYIGYCMEMLQTFGTAAGLDMEDAPGLEEAIGDLKKFSDPALPLLFFHYPPRRQFVTVDIIAEHTPAEAKAWGLLTGIPVSEFEGCFRDYVGV